MASLDQFPTQAQRRRRHGRVSAAVAVLAVAWLLTLGLLYAAGYRPLVVQSASMAPTVATGDLIITKAVRPAGVSVGDVVSFHDRTRTGRLVTHRVTESRRDGREIAFVTRGDVNEGTERWSSDADARIGRLALRIPFAGYAATWLTRLPITLGLLAIVSLLFANAVLAARATRSANRVLSRSMLAAMASAATIVSAPIVLAATDGAFSAVAANAANSFQAANSFFSAGPVTVTSNADTYVDENNPNTNYGASTSMQIVSVSGQNKRSLVQFALPTPPADPDCSLASVFLRLEPVLSSTGRTLQAKRLTSAFGEFTAKWALQPSFSNVDIAIAPSGSTTISFDVKLQVLAMYAPGANFGFLVRDSVEGAFAIQAYPTREYSQDRPILVFTYA